MECVNSNIDSQNKLSDIPDSDFNAKDELRKQYKQVMQDLDRTRSTEEENQLRQSKYQQFRLNIADEEQDEIEN